MDLEKNIEIAFEVYWKNLPVTTELNTGTHSDAFIAGAKSQAAKDFWYNEFKREHVSTDELTDQEKLDIEYGLTEYYPSGTVQNDPLYGAINKMLDNVTPKHVDIIDHIDHDKPISCVIIGVGSQIIIHEPIEFIVPIVDVVPEPIMSKQELLKMHDNAVERTIANETFKESRAWDIKKQKKVSHKRNNKRK